jgi:hypothetical protein
MNHRLGGGTSLVAVDLEDSVHMLLELAPTPFASPYRCGWAAIDEGLPIPREPALAASEGRMPRAQPPSSERRAGMPEASVRISGCGQPRLAAIP